MKKAFSIFVMTLFANFVSAHPGIEHHSHDSALGELAWLILPLIAIVVLGSFYYRREGKKRLE